MAVTSTTGFFRRGSLYGIDPAAGMDFIINDSDTIKIGDCVRLDADGLVTNGSANAVPILGIVTGLVDKNGINVFSPRASGTTGCTLTPDDQVTVSSTNSSDATRYIKAQVQLDPAGVLLWYNDSDGTLAQTNLGQFFDIVSAADQISASSASNVSGTFQLVKIDPDGDADASKGLFRLVESQLMTEVGNGGSGANVTVIGS